MNGGNGNIGICNTGNCNTGNRNGGNHNSGDFNTGNRNSGDFNTGDYNTGRYNIGDLNSGQYNSGYGNSGDWNSGSWNSGDGNSGDWNCGNWNSGIFSTKKIPTIKAFDKDSDWTIADWYDSTAYSIMQSCPISHSEFIFEDIMSEEEKEKHPEYKVVGGYTKAITVKAEDRQKWWDDLPDMCKKAVMALPNFDADKFYQCTEIRV